MLLTVIIRDESPWGCQEPATYRRVTVRLTEEQAKALALRHKAEVYSTTFVEPGAPAETTSAEVSCSTCRYRGPCSADKSRPCEGWAAETSAQGVDFWRFETPGSFAEEHPVVTDEPAPSSSEGTAAPSEDVTLEIARAFGKGYSAGYAAARLDPPAPSPAPSGVSGLDARKED